MQLTWQDAGALVVVALAVLFLADRFVFAARRKAKGAANKPDVPVNKLVRKPPNKR